MLLYRYMSYKYWRESVEQRKFATQYPSAFEDLFEGNVNIRNNIKFSSSAFNSIVTILCFNKVEGTSKADENQLWSRYADRSKGVRVVFDMPCPESMSSRFFMAQDVAYSDDVHELTFPLTTTAWQGLDAHVLADVFFTKDTSWNWENEFRMLFFSDEESDCVSKRVLDKPDSLGRKWIWFAHFPKEWIVGVDFGARIPELDNKAEVCLRRVAEDVAAIRKLRPEFKFGIMQRRLNEKALSRIDFDEYKTANTHLFK